MTDFFSPTLAFHWLLSSFLVFLGMVLFIELIFLIFGVIHPRLKASLYVLPILKLPIDLLFPRLELPFNFNPIGCDSLVSDLLLSGECPKKILAEWLPNEFMFSAFVVVMSVSSVRFFKKILELIQSRRYIRDLLRNCTLIEVKNGVKIWGVDGILSPCAVWRKGILLPKTLVSELTPEELSAVIEHEMDHIRWMDPMIRTSLRMIGSLFWWIPVGWLLRKIEALQEAACDFKAKGESDGLDLASAMVKVAAHAKNKAEFKFQYCSFLEQRENPVNRIREILKPSSMQALWTWGNVIVTAVNLSLLILFWIC